MKESINKILIIRLSAMGDVLLTTPLIRVMRKQFPGARIDFMVKNQFAPLLQFNPYLNQIINIESKQKPEERKRVIQEIQQVQYDAVIDLQKNLRSAAFRRKTNSDHVRKANLMRWNRFLLVYFNIQAYKDARPVPLKYMESTVSWGVEDDGLGLDLFVNPDVKKKIHTLLKEQNQQNKPVLVLAPGAGRNTKRWLPERFAEAGKEYSRRGYHIALVGGSSDRSVGDFILNKTKDFFSNFIGRFSLQETAALITEAACLVTNDTGIMHIGAALKTPMVTVFGPTTRDFGFYPFRANAAIVEKDLPCRPCSFHGTTRCPKKHFRCMKDIETVHVLKAIASLIEKEAV